MSTKEVEIPAGMSGRSRQALPDLHGPYLHPRSFSEFRCTYLGKVAPHPVIQVPTFVSCEDVNQKHQLSADESCVKTHTHSPKFI